MNEEMQGALAGRAALYDLLASLYFRPLTGEQVEEFASADLSPYAELNELCAQGAHDMESYLAKRHSGTRQELAIDFTGCFGGTSTWEGRTCVPYESVFRSEEGLLYQEPYHQLYETYRSCGVTRREGFDFPDDHLSLMFEFLSLLATRAAEALAANDTASALADLRVSLDVVENHVASWFPDLRDLALELLNTRFYRGVLRITEGFVQFDAESLREMCAELEGLSSQSGTVVQPERRG